MANENLPLQMDSTATRIREYEFKDRITCISIFDSNVPAFFHAAERNLFIDCLESTDFLPPRLRSGGAPKGRMYVVESGERIVGCGGWFLDGPVAALSWGMIHQSLHGSGLGRILLLERLEAVRKDGRAETVRVKTTPSVQGFFERAGFEVTLSKTPGLVDDVPLVELSLTL
jgi:N-acetylglutamate synthase-like GNAT family acetyltransferase